MEPKLISPLQDCIFKLFWPLGCHKWSLFSKGPSLKMYQTFWTTPCISYDAARINFTDTTPKLKRTKYDFPTPRPYFYTILTIMTSQMAIFLKRAILKNWPNFFHNYMYILVCCEEQFYGDHAHAGRTKYDFPLPRLYFYTILTIMTSQMAILLERVILKNWLKFFHNSMCIWGCCEEQFYGDHTHAGWTKYDFPPHRLYFYPILTHMTSQMAILL